jgi:hypothetical protein
MYVWHASDDTFCSPKIGICFSDHFTENGATANFKNENFGYNHMTYSNEHYKQPKTNIDKALMDGILK